jgi:hypothetical protein
MTPREDAGARDAGAADGAAGDGGGTDGGGMPPLRVASITATSGPGASYQVSASFAAYADRDDGCTRMTAGSCALSDCPLPPKPFDAVEAGTITVSTGTATATLTPDGAGRYDTATGSTALFAGGDTVTFAASGSTMGGVRMFMDTLTAPSTTTLTSPAVSAPSGSFTLPDTGGIDLAWTPVGGSALSAQLGVSDAGAGRLRAARCTFDASLGSATVPDAALAFLGRGSMAVYSLWTETSKESGAGGGWNVTLTARAPVGVSVAPAPDVPAPPGT